MGLLGKEWSDGSLPGRVHSDATTTVMLLTVSGNGMVDVGPLPPSELPGSLAHVNRVRVSRVLGLSGPWTADDLRATLEGVSQMVLAVRGCDSHGHLLADVVGICDGPASTTDPTLGVVASGR